MTSPARGVPDTAGMREAIDPRFRDQLAEVLECANWCNSNYPSTGGGLSLLSPAPGCDCLETHRLPQADALMPAIAAEVEARVQAAAKDAVERAAQAVEALRPHIPPSTDPNRRTAVIVRSTLNRAARAARADALAAAAQPTDGRTWT